MITKKGSVLQSYFKITSIHACTETHTHSQREDCIKNVIFLSSGNLQASNFSTGILTLIS